MTTPVEQHQNDTEALAANTAAGALAVYAALRSGELSVPEAGTVIAVAVATANAAAGALADRYVAAAVEQATGTPTPAVGIPPRDDTPRLTKAVRTILDDATVSAGTTDADLLFTESQESADPTPETPPLRFNGSPASRDERQPPPTPDDPDPVAIRVERLARAEPLAAAQQATVAVMDAQPKVVGWRRAMDADPCELCQFWYRNGRVYRTTTAFQSHPGCNCQPEIVTEKEKSA